MNDWQLVSEKSGFWLCDRNGFWNGNLGGMKPIDRLSHICNFCRKMDCVDPDSQCTARSGLWNILSQNGAGHEVSGHLARLGRIIQAQIRCDLYCNHCTITTIVTIVAIATGHSHVVMICLMHDVIYACVTGTWSETRRHVLDNYVKLRNRTTHQRHAALRRSCLSRICCFSTFCDRVRIFFTFVFTFLHCFYIC